jgi:hypothetical protein
LASRIEPDFRDQFAMARAHFGKATLRVRRSTRGFDDMLRQ